MLIAQETGCVFGPSWVSPHAVLQGAPDPPAFKPFLSRSFVVGSTCWVGIWVRGVIKCSCFMCRRCVTVGIFLKLRKHVFWVAFGHVVELGLGTELITILDKCRREQRGGGGGASIWQL